MLEVGDKIPVCLKEFHVNMECEVSMITFNPHSGYDVRVRMIQNGQDPRDFGGMLWVHMNKKEVEEYNGAN